MKIYGIIYMIRNKINGKIYFGQTLKDYEFDKRYAGGKWWTRTRNEHLKRSAEKYGHENFEVNKCFDVAYSQEELDDLEDLYICMYNTLDSKYGYNKKRGGSQGRHTKETRKKISEKHAGKKLSEETKKKMSDSRKGELNPQYGIPRTEEQKRKQSETMKKKFEDNPRPKKVKEKKERKPFSEEGKKKLSDKFSGEGNPMYGKHHSEETKIKIKKQLEGKYTGENNPNTKRVSQYTKDGRFIKTYGSIKQAAVENNICNSSIGQCCKGKLKSAGGYVWKFE